MAQLMWSNLVDVLPALGLALEPPEPDVMLRPPRPAEEAVPGGRDWAGLAGGGGVIAAGGLLGVGPLDAAVTLGAGVLPRLVNRTLRTPSSDGQARPGRDAGGARILALPDPFAPAAGRGSAGYHAKDRPSGAPAGRFFKGEDHVRRETSIQVHSYRGHRIEVRDDGGDGWAVVVHPRPGEGGAPETVRSGMPNGLADLLAEARRRVDRRSASGLGGFRA